MEAVSYYASEPIAESAVLDTTAKAMDVAAFVAQHDCVAVVDITLGTLTVCSSYTRWLGTGRKTLGFLVERIPATRQAARDWLNY